MNKIKFNGYKSFYDDYSSILINPINKEETKEIVEALAMINYGENFSITFSADDSRDGQWHQFNFNQEIQENVNGGFEQEEIVLSYTGYR